MKKRIYKIIKTDVGIRRNKQKQGVEGLNCKDEKKDLQNYKDRCRN